MNTVLADPSTLPVQPAHQLPVRPEAQRWLVTDLWLEQAVGLVGGEPKCCKSFLALDLAVAVASGTACLRRYSVDRPGRVLLYAAEDALHIVRGRLEGICAAAGCSLGLLDLQVITAPTLRLDLPADRDRLLKTVEHRAAPSLAPVALELAQRGEALALQLRNGAATTPPPTSIDERITQALRTAGRPVTVAELRELCRIRNATLHERLTVLTRSGQLLRDDHGYRLNRSNGTLTASGA